MVLKKMRHWYIGNFVNCKKCGKRINPKKGFWTWKNHKPIIGGIYHTECGMINNPKKIGVPF